MTYCTGRLPATRPAALSDFDVYAKGKIARPPTEIAVPQTVYPMDRNDVEGDCTVAGVDHVNRALNALYPANAVRLPTEPMIEREYRKLTGGEDTGLNEADLLRHWYRSGLWGSKIAGYAPVNPDKLLSIHQAIAYYGAAYLGILCPQSAQEQARNNEPWTYVGEEAEDGHCVVALGYDRNGDLLIASWGSIFTMTAGFRAHYLEEAWVVLGPQIVGAKQDTLMIDVEALQADLALV